MENKLLDMINELEHQLEHLPEQREAVLNQARMQLAELAGRYLQKEEDLKKEIERLNNLIEDESLSESNRPQPI
ncbi:MAG: hypothetical protein AAF702_44405 [Chloroflexota bacterium]